MKRRAILSLTDKNGLEEFGRGLMALGFELCASGGTAKALRGAGLDTRDISELSGQEEILGGRVKTLHPAVHAGILAPTVESLEGTGYGPVEIVAVNLYDFGGALGEGADEAGLVEKIDIGGPTMLRAAAKNFSRCWVIADPADYPRVLECLESGDEEAGLIVRKELAAKVFALTHQYDGMISKHLFSAAHHLRYGENPHQDAAWRVAGGGGLQDLGLELHGGKEPSYNNFLDVVSALKLAFDLPENGCVIMKHTNPCGVGMGATPREAFDNALACDPISAFGGIVAFPGVVDLSAAERLGERFLEVVLASSFTPDARERLAKKKNLRCFSVDRQRFSEATRGSLRAWGRLELEQDEDEGFPEFESLEHAAGPAPKAEDLAAAKLAWRVAKHVKSNAIVLAGPQGTLGIGAGQMSRVDSSRIAIEKARIAGLDIQGVVAASDGFFPFADGLEQLAEAGIKTIIQPGGSIRDQEVKDAADARGVTLLLTGTRHFRH